MGAWKKRWPWVGAAVLAVVALVGLRLRGGGNSSELRFETAAVDRGRVVAKVTATGTLSATVTVQVGSQVSGRIQQILVDFNSPVKKGQLIAKIDPQLFEAALEESRANTGAARGELTSAQVQAEEAARQLERTKTLAERKLIAQAELDTATARAASARAQVEVAQGRAQQARAALHQAEVNLQFTNILSPIDGVVISRSVDVGQTVAASLQAPTLFILAEDLSKMQVDTSVAEADVGKLEAGMAASFVVDAYPTERFEGSVRQIRNSPQTVQNVVTYDAVIDVANPGLKLKPGMTANVTFVAAEREDALRVPNAALRFRPTPELLAKVRAGQGGRRGGADGGTGGPRMGRAGGGGGPPAMDRSGGSGPPDRRTVWVLRNGEPASVQIRIGVSDGSATEVVEGELREGDAVITEVVGGEPAAPTRPPGGGGGGRGFGRVF